MGPKLGECVGVLRHWDGADSGTLTPTIYVCAGSSRFDKDLDTALQRVLQLQRTQQLTARQHSALLWALARIGFQSSTVESVITNCCTAIAQEVWRCCGRHIVSAACMSMRCFDASLQRPMHAGARANCTAQQACVSGCNDCAG